MKELTDVLLFSLYAYGLSNIIVKSSIMRPFRKQWSLFFEKRKTLKKLPHCMMCTGLWVGLLHPIVPNILINAFAGSGTVWIIYLLTRRIGCDDPDL